MSLWNKILSWNFWFNLRPGHLMPVYHYILIGFTVLLFVLSSMFYIKKQNPKKKKNVNLPLWRHLYYFSLTNGILGLLFIFFNYQMVPFFSSRFWYPLWMLVMLVWLYFISRLLKTVPERIREKEKVEQYTKYLPHKNK